MPETHQNKLKFDPRWNKGDYHSSLYTGTRFSVHSGQNGTDLITLLRSLYPHQVCNEIFSMPISKTGCFNDKLLWKHSSSRDFPVHKAYSLLLEDFQASCSNSRPSVSIPKVVWSLIWRVKLPMKIGTFLWKLLHDCLPIFLNLNNKGINVNRDCPFYNAKVGRSTNLFLSFQFARAIWHGSTLCFHTSSLSNISIQNWICSLLVRHKKLILEDMSFLQKFSTILWSIWNHRNVVVHDNIQPNPLGVLLMAQTLSCRYHEAFSKEESQQFKEYKHSSDPNPAGGQWQIVLKLAGAKRRGHFGSAFAYQAKNKQGEVVFWGVRSCAASSATGAFEKLWWKPLSK